VCVSGRSIWLNRLDVKESKMRMTVGMFMKKFDKLMSNRRRWRRMYGSDYSGGIRVTKVRGSYSCREFCPITAVCCEETELFESTGRSFQAGKRLGLGRRDIRSIVHASDRIHDSETRRKLIAAVERLNKC